MDECCFETYESFIELNTIFLIHMEFLECIKLYANKPANSVVNTSINKPEIIDWNERLQTIRRSIIDQLSRLKIEEMSLRNLALKNDQNKRINSTINTLTIPLSSTNNNQDNLLTNNRKRFCTIPSNNFDADTINQSELDLEP